MIEGDLHLEGVSCILVRSYLFNRATTQYSKPDICHVSQCKQKPLEGMPFNLNTLLRHISNH